MIADASQMLYISYPRFHAFFLPAEGLLQGWHLSDSQNQKTRCLYTAKKITQRRFYTQKPLHREGFTQSSFYTDAFAHRRFYIQKLLHRKALSPQKAFKQSSFTHRRFFTKKFLHHRNFNAQMPKLLHTGAFAHTCLTKRSF